MECSRTPSSGRDCLGCVSIWWCFMVPSPIQLLNDPSSIVTYVGVEPPSIEAVKAAWFLNDESRAINLNFSRMEGATNLELLLEEDLVRLP